jgi:alpha-tubulin suppressor-like RCC1 family protein
VQIASDSNWVSIGLGSAHSAGLKSDGTLWAWGDNIYGQLGDGTKTSRTQPQQVGKDNNWVALSVGNTYNLALKTDGSLWAWGLNTNGQLGDGSTVNRTSPIQIGTVKTWSKIFAGAYHSMAIRSDGSLWAWGNNSDGQLGDRTTTNRLNPVKIGTDTKWTQISTGSFHTLGLKSDGSLWAWGWNVEGEMGDSSTISKDRPIQIGEETQWTKISGSLGFSLGIKADGTLWSWGSNKFGQLGLGDTLNRLKPVRVGLDSNWVEINSGIYHSIGLKSDGSILVWGSNNFFQLGDSGSNMSKSPVKVSSKLDVWLNISAGKNHTLGLKTTGTLLAWGSNAFGELGIGTTSNKVSPVEINSEHNWTNIAAGNNFSLALKSDGSLWSWGFNSNGELGLGNNIQIDKPKQIGTERDWVSIAAGANHSLFLKSNGTLWVSGKNDKGQLGDGTKTDRNIPTKVKTDSNWVSIVAGQEYSFGIKSNGTLWAWGNNKDGALGLGDTINQVVPKQVTGGNWISIDAGLHTMGLKSDGTLWAWGKGTDGQLGNGKNQNELSPLKISKDTSWLAIAVGDNHSFGIKSDGTIHSWGNNTSGQLGDGNNTDLSIPTQIGTENNWVKISCGSDMSIGLKANRNKFCATGENKYGQLGDATTKNRNSFFCLTNFNCAPQAPQNTTPTQNLSICFGKGTQLKAQGVGKLGWYDKITGGKYLGKDSVLNVKNLTQTQIFYVQDSTCEASLKRTAIQVNVRPPLKITTDLKDTTVCYGEKLIFIASAKGGDSSNYTYRWLINEVLLSGKDSLFLNTTNSFSDKGEVKTLKLLLNDHCSLFADSVVKIITVLNKPKPDFSWGLACAEQKIQFNYTGNKPINKYYWNLNSEAIDSIENPIIQFKVPGIKKIKLTVFSNSCTDTIIKAVMVNPQPKAAFDVKDICQNDTAFFTNQSLNAKFFYWQFGDGESSQIQSPKHRFKYSANTQTYQVSIQVKDSSGCKDSLSKNIKVMELPESKFTWIQSGKDYVFKANQTGNTYYRWLFNETDSIVGLPVESFPFINLNKVCLKVKNANNCVSETCETISTGSMAFFKGYKSRIYPNPNQGNFTIDITPSNIPTKVEIFNTLGQIIYLDNIFHTQKFDLMLENGVYLIRLTNGKRHKQPKNIG